MIMVNVTTKGSIINSKLNRKKFASARAFPKYQAGSNVINTDIKYK